jgi:hypothetical protein
MCKTSPNGLWCGYVASDIFQNAPCIFSIPRLTMLTPDKCGSRLSGERKEIKTERASTEIQTGDLLLSTDAATTSSCDFLCHNIELTFIIHYEQDQRQQILSRCF